MQQRIVKVTIGLLGALRAGHIKFILKGRHQPVNPSSPLVLADIYLEMAPFLVTRLSDSSYLVFNSNGKGAKTR